MRALQHLGDGLMRLVNRRVFRLHGNDVGKYLQGLTTNDIRPLEEQGSSIYTAFLTAKGRILADAHLVKTSDASIQVDCHEECADDLLRHLRRYKLRSKVTIDEDPDLRSVWTLLPVKTSPQALAEYHCHHTMVEDEGIVGYKDSRGIDFGWRYMTTARPEPRR